MVSTARFEPVGFRQWHLAWPVYSLREFLRILATITILTMTGTAFGVSAAQAQSTSSAKAGFSMENALRHANNQTGGGAIDIAN